MVLYLILCLTSVLAGCGILGLLGIDVDRRHTLFLAPVVSLCCVALIMGSFVAGGFTVGEITPAAYALCIGAAILGVVRQGKTVLAGWRSLLVLAGLPLLILLPSILDGFVNYGGGTCLDNWSYVTVGQSLQHYPLGADGWLPVGVQYAAHWGKATRFISPAFLAFLAPLSGPHNDTQEVLGQYVGWLFFVYASACLFFVGTIRLNRTMAWLFVYLAVLSGWSIKLVNANSVDNTVALSLLPAMAGILFLFSHPSARHGILLGLIMAAGLYTYPEVWPFLVAAVCLISIERVCTIRSPLRNFGRLYLAAAITIGICIAPYAAEMVSFFRQELMAASAPLGSRPGEPFYHSLLTRGYVLTGFWGLTPDFDKLVNAEIYLSHYHLYAVVTSWILTLAVVLGVFLLLRQRNWSLPVFAILMTAGYAVFLIRLQYPYGAYKLLMLTWFVIAYMTTVALEYVWGTVRSPSSAWIGRTASSVGLLAFMAAGASFLLQQRMFYNSLPFKSLREFKTISAVGNLAAGVPVAMVVNDTFANIWGAHFLRKTKLYLAGEYRGYMVGYASVLDRSELVDPSKIQFVVTDNPSSMENGRLLSRIGPYYVWDCRHGPWVLLTEIQNPNGVEGGNAGPFVWMGKGDTALSVLSPGSMSAIVSAQFALGPSLPGQARQRVLVQGKDFEEDLVIGNGQQSFSVPIHAGLNRIVLRPLEKPTAVLPQDPRPLLINASHISVSIPERDGTAQIREIDNPNGLESWFGKEPFFWMGGGDTVVTVAASEPGTAQFTATILPGPSLVDSTQARLLLIPSSGAKIQRDLAWGPACIPIPVQAGRNRIVMRALGANRHNAEARGDPRIMMIGFRNLQASFVQETRECN